MIWEIIISGVMYCIIILCNAMACLGSVWIDLNVIVADVIMILPFMDVIQALLPQPYQKSSFWFLASKIKRVPFIHLPTNSSSLTFASYSSLHSPLHNLGIAFDPYHSFSNHIFNLLHACLEIWHLRLRVTQRNSKRCCNSDLKRYGIIEYINLYLLFCMWSKI